MKALLKYTIFITLATISIMLITINLVNVPSGNNDMLLNNIYNNSNDSYDVTLQQLKGQLSFFRKAVDELGATSPTQAADLWAKAMDTRNGILRYAVACNNMKIELINKWGKPEESFWNIRGSSPWIREYELLNITKINSSTYEITIKYYWVAVGYLDIKYETLTIIKKDNYWCVSDVK